MSFSKISLRPASASDYLAIAKLEGDTFADEDFSAVAFGPNRLSDESRAFRAKGLAEAAAAQIPGETLRNTIAVITQSDGKEEIVGSAIWNTCVGRGGSEEEKMRLGVKESWVEKEEQKKIMDSLSPGAVSPSIFEDAFVRGDELMARSTQGRDYAKLNVLVVSPNYQRRGIGTMLLEEGLRVVDEAGLQAVLGSSPLGIGLYRKFGFVDFEVITLKLWEYEGGAGMGLDSHVIMNRPAVARRV